MFDNSVVRSLGGSFLSKGLGVDAEESAGGLISLWNDDFFKVHSCISCQRCTILAGYLVSMKKDMVFCNVYAPNVESERKILWDFIVDAQGSLPMSWCSGGDFNTVLDPSERRGGVCNAESLSNFNLFTIRAKVFNIPIQGLCFTWTNSRERVCWEILDRFLISSIILSWFPNLVQQGHPRSVSNHSAISIGVQRVDWGPTPFRVFNSWLEDREAMALVRKG